MSILVSNNQVNVKTEEGFESINVLADIGGLDDLYAAKTDTVLNTTLSMGRKAGTQVGDKSSAVGYNVEASAQASHAEGRETHAIDTSAHAEGFRSIAEGSSSHAEGWGSHAQRDYSHAEGGFTSSKGFYSHAEGLNSESQGDASHAEGDQTTAKGRASHSEGEYTIATADYSHVEGKYNKEDTEGKYVHIVGNGTANTEAKRSNAHTLDWSGNAWYAGSLTLNKTELTEQDLKSLLALIGK